MNSRTITMLFLLAGLAAPLYAEEPRVLGIEAHGFSPKQIKTLQGVLTEIQNFKKRKLKIARSVYEQNSTYKALFGFEFNGPQTVKWLQKRIDKFTYYDAPTVAANQGRGQVQIGRQFFASNKVEQMYMLIHEARHSDGDYSHVNCPAGFGYISASQPEVNLQRQPGCDNKSDGAYAYQAAFLFELYAYGYFDQEKLGLLYNSVIARVLPSHTRIASNLHGRYFLTAEPVFEFKKRREIVARVNNFKSFQFNNMYQTKDSATYYSGWRRQKTGIYRPYVLIVYRTRALARAAYKEKAQTRTDPYFIIGSLVVYCPYGDVHNLFSRLKVVLTGMGMKIN